MFTRISKVVLWILLAGVVIAGFILLGIDVGISLIVWGGGLVVIYGFGIFVELINNVLDIKNILKSMNDNGYSMGAPVQQVQEPVLSYDRNGSQNQYNHNQNSQNQYNSNQYGQNNGSQNTRSESRMNLSAVAAASTTQSNASSGWYCRECGTKNKTSSRICMGCGKYK